MKLGEVCNVVRGSSPRPKSDPRFYGGNVPRLMVADLTRDGKVVSARIDSLTELGAKQSRLMTGGDVVIAVSGAPGLPAILAHDACIHDGFVGLRDLDKKRVDPEFLYAYLTFVRATSNSQAVGAIFKNLTTDQIKDIEIPILPLAEQQRIAEVLDRAEALRAKRRAALAELDALTQAIFLDMFGDPVLNPKGWEMVKLASVGALDRGVSKHRPRNAPELLGGKHPLVQTGEVANCDGYIRSYTSTYSDIGLKQSKMWSAGTLCITIAANIAKTGILMFDACFPDSVVGFRAPNSATVEFVRVWLSFLQKTLEDNAPESAQKNINLALLRGLDVPLPPLSLQQQFAWRIAAVEKLKAAHRTSLAELDALFASLQHRAFRGEL